MGGGIARRAARLDQRTRRERAANSVDRYSLVLQLVQVFPIISGAAVVLVTTTWAARAFSAAGLIAGTVWVLRLERIGAKAAPEHRDAADAPPQPVVPARRGDASGRTAVVVLTDPSGRREGAAPGEETVLSEVVCEYREINISIRLRPASPRTAAARTVPVRSAVTRPAATRSSVTLSTAAARRRERRLRGRAARSRPATPRSTERTALEREINPRRSWTPLLDSVGVHEPRPRPHGGGIG